MIVIRQFAVALGLLALLSTSAPAQGVFIMGNNLPIGLFGYSAVQEELEAIRKATRRLFACP